MKTMVFGDDRSAGSDVAWLWINLQSWPTWSVDVVEVRDGDHGPRRPNGPTKLEPWTPDDPRRAFVEADFASVQLLTAEGDPRLVLGDRDDADLVVVGATGRGLLKQWLHLGSTTEWLMNQPTAPLLVARSARAVRRVIICVDGSDAAQRAVRTFAELPLAAECEVVVLGVYDGWSEPAAGIKAAIETLDEHGIRHHHEEIAGRPKEVILRELHERQPHLVVIGAAGANALRKTMAGSTASAVTRAAPCNVLLVG